MLNLQDSADVQYDEQCLTRHWCPLSEPFTTGDALLTAVHRGWFVKGVIFRQEIWLSDVRRIFVYHVELQYDDQSRKMQVLENPFVERIVHQLAQVVQLNQRKHTEYQRW